jgi:hypothetical protein
MSLSDSKLKSAKFGVALAVAATSAVCCSPAQAATFTFDDIVYISTSSMWSTVFSPYRGPPLYSSAGYYQVLQTNTGNFWSGLTPPNSSANPTYVFKNPGNVPIGGEWIQNDPNFPTTPPLNGTESEDKLVLQGFAAAAVNGAVVQKVYTTTTNASYFEFTAPTGIGSPTSFTFNSFDLSGSAQNVVFSVQDSSFNTVFTSQPYNLTSTAQHIVVHVPNAYKVLFTSGSSTASALNMDNVEINDPYGVVPAPPIGRGLPVLLAAGGILFGAKLLGRSKRRRWFGTLIPHAAAI